MADFDDFDFDSFNVDEDQEEYTKKPNPTLDEIEMKFIDGEETDNAPSVKPGDEYIIYPPPTIYSIAMLDKENNGALIREDGKIKIRVVDLFGSGVKQQVRFEVYNNEKNKYVGMNEDGEDAHYFQAPAKTHRMNGIGIDQLALHGEKINKGGKKRRTAKKT
jgi:hypothetical protein